ncbi:MAG TPA: polyprenyl synthetase family protein [Methanomassiliicoccales archaeon]|jgi:geranylgeranyl diphosphate synthase type II
MGLVKATGPSREAAIVEPMMRRCSSYPVYLERIKPAIDERIMRSVCNDANGALDRRLENPLRQGKRMRAGLLMLIFETYGQERYRDMALDLASAIEIAHAASLIVDDMLDEDVTRHGSPTMHITAGHKSAILGTIGLISYPYQITSRYGEEYVLGMARTHRAMVQGASREMRGAPSVGVKETYDGIIEMKTGQLFGLAARYGALVAGCTPEVTEMCSEFGNLTGRAMQIADDVTDLEALLNGKKAGIRGSEAILLRCCLGRIGEPPEEVERDVGGDVGPLDKAHRQDIEKALGGYLEAAIKNAVGAVHRLMEGIGPQVQDNGNQKLPELGSVPAEIAAMVLKEAK